MSAAADSRALARQLVAELDAQVLKRWNPRRQILVPAQLSAQVEVRSAKVGETVIDLADPLIDAACEDWPEAAARLDIYMDLLNRGKQWFIEWVVEDPSQIEAELPGFVDLAPDEEAGE